MSYPVKKGRWKGRGKGSRLQWDWSAWNWDEGWQMPWDQDSEDMWWYNFQSQPWQGKGSHVLELEPFEQVPIPFDPEALPFVLGRKKENLERLKGLPGVESIDIHTNAADGQFQGRVFKEVYLVVSGTRGAIERIEKEVKKAELLGKSARSKSRPQRRLHLVTAKDDFRALTFVKANMEKCLCSFASFQNRQYYELRVLQTGAVQRTATPSEQSSHLSIDLDCSCLMDVLKDETGLRDCNKVTIRLGRLLYHGIGAKAKGVLSPEHFKQLRLEDFTSQFSRHLRSSQKAAEKLLNTLTGEWKVQERCHDTKVRFSLLDSRLSENMPQEVELTFKAPFDRKKMNSLPSIQKLVVKKPPVLHSDVDFMDANVAVRVELGVDREDPDLKQQFASGSFRQDVLHLTGSATFKLDRITHVQKVARDGHVVIVWTKAMDFFHEDQVPYEALHLVSPSLNESLRAGEIQESMKEFERLVKTMQKLVELLPKSL